MIDNIPVLIIEADVNEIQANSQVIFEMSIRFDNDDRCSISDYRIERVTEANTNLMI